ncbi:hypothetical protein [Aquiflexum sp.]|uniref:hypothetical protein n=1 Tax=Aquiflexum sp. TaxID=1872584 RepID=UPI003593EA52
MLSVSPAGVKGDEFGSNNGKNRDSRWSPIWDVKSAIDDGDWTAEMRILLSLFRFGNEEEQVFC